MTADLPAIKRDLAAFAFTPLFIERLGWDHLRSRQPIQVGDEAFTLQGIAQKSGFAVFRCEPGPDGRIPPSAVRRKIDGQLAKLHLEHLLVFTDRDQTEQVWLFAHRQPGQPIRHRERRFRRGDQGELLAQQLRQLQVSLQEDIAGIDIGLIAARVRGAMDVEKVTKKFYERYKKEHELFRDAIDGIPEGENRDWYASVMLNRLMFVYFIQKKGFLDNDPDYLRKRQDATLAVRGAGQFLTFYRHFLRRLFHDGLGAPESERDAALRQLIGDVPYLNGGLFDEHQLEEAHRGIDIPDAAFTRLFDFFDAYQWRLDESGRHGRADNEIDPDVLGYIFEKYINQKQMGAYYTKEDVTGYISQNTIIPAVFDKAMPHCRIAFAPDGEMWRLLRESPDDYIYPAVRHGMDLDLPAEIDAGVHDVSRRGGWNAPAPADYALPTETWRELVARRQRCADLRERLGNGEVTRIDDLVTLNLDIRQFAEDAISSSASPDLVRAFWKALTEVTVLDPTCGSGAFLFAALNVLEPLYEACLDRMQGFLDDLERDGDRHSPAKFSDFRKELDDIARHPNREYFIYKRIILDNLYGVDIMEEAVEICKLRLFLKLVSQVNDARRIEPLPDIDFNIRQGNTLVGFATANEVEAAITGKGSRSGALRMDLQQEMPAITERIEAVADATALFRQMQSDSGMTAGDFRNAKELVESKLESLDNELDRAMARQQGIVLERRDGEKVFAAWRNSHDPFHWFAEFYRTISSGGFDVIIGNPPYIATSKIRKLYRTSGYRTEDCSDIYALVLERVSKLVRSSGRSGMIVPLSLTFSENFTSLRAMLYEEYGTNWFSSFARIPAALFSHDVRVRNTIHLGSKQTRPKGNYTSVTHRWFEQARPHLFANLQYHPYSHASWQGLIPKASSTNMIRVLQEWLQSEKTVVSSMSTWQQDPLLRFKQSAYNWLCFAMSEPPAYNADGQQIPHTMFGDANFVDEKTRDLAFLLLNGKIMFSFWVMIGDDFHLTKWMFEDLPIDLNSFSESSRNQLKPKVAELRTCMEDNTSFKKNAGKNIGNFNLARCRHVTDQSDRIILDELGNQELWDDIELMYAQIVKTSFEEEDE